jgi:hypothetical protein
MPRLTSSAPLRNTRFRIKNFSRHTVGSPASALVGVWNTSDTNTIRVWQDEALVYGALEMESGRSTSVLHVRGHQVGDEYSGGCHLGIADAVQVPLSSNSAASHPFPFNSARLVGARCKYCSGPII